MKKQWVVAAGTLVALSTMAPLLGAGTAFADDISSQAAGTSSTQSTSTQSTSTQSTNTTKAVHKHETQDLIKQLDALDKRLDRADRLADQLDKAFATLHQDETKQKDAHHQYRVTKDEYTKLVQKYLGHDDGTIAKTEPTVKDLMDHVKDTAKADRKAERKDLEAAIDAVQHHRYDQAIDDLQRAEAHAKNATDTFRDAAAKLKTIDALIWAHADRSGDNDASPTAQAK